MKAVRDTLNKNQLALPFRDEEMMRELQLLTAKKQIYLLNGQGGNATRELVDRIKSIGADYLIADLASVQQLPELTRKAYEVLDLISFFTTGEDETRAWTIRRGAKAPEAAGVIHTDFEKNFIRAEVISCQELLASGSWQLTKQKGLIRLEGKEYVVQNGDVMIVRHG